MKLRLAAALGLSAAVSLAACTPANEVGTSSGASLQGTLKGIGASAQDVAQLTWSTGFQQTNSGVTINYSPEGSGTGRENFISGGAHYAGSDRAFKLAEIEKNTFKGCVDGTKPLNLPVYISPIAVVFNLDGIKSLNLTPTTVAKIFKGEITKWNDPAIVADNAGVQLPDLTISVVYRADTSGTTENFAGYLAKTASDIWTAEVSGDWPYKGGEAAQQTQGVVSAIKAGKGTIGYVDASQASQFSTVAIGKDGKFFEPSAENAAKIVDNSPVEDGRAAGDLAIALDRKAEGYPIVLVSYLIVCQDYKDDKVAELVKGYASYIVSEAGQQAAAARAGSAPLSASLREKVQTAITSIK